MDTALSPPVGRLLGGRYHVGSQIARGGMATVYLGTDTRLDRVVAIKIAHPELAGDAGGAPPPAARPRRGRGPPRGPGPGRPPRPRGPPPPPAPPRRGGRGGGG